MRFARLIPLLGVLSTTSLVRAADKEEKKNGPTTFNGVEVPPLLELTDKTYEHALKEHKFLMIKHYRYGSSTPWFRTEAAQESGGLASRQAH
jgi:hypothetical protein